MSQILVWKSDTDGKLFEDKTKYTKHLRALAVQRTMARKVEKSQVDRTAFLVKMGKSVASIAELEQFIKDNWDWFFGNGMQHELWQSDRRPSTPHQLTNIRIDVRWSNSVSNTHCAPLDGVQNWAQSDPKNAHLPKGYPGWTGDIYYTVDAGTTTHKRPRSCSGYGSSYFKNSMINTGSGSGADSCRYSVKLFAADFPGLVEGREKGIVWSALTDINREFA